MRTNYLFILCLLWGYLPASAQTPVTGSTPVTATPVVVPGAYTNPSVNFIRSWVPSMPTTDVTTVMAPGRSTAEVKQSTQYIDGLGRPVQSVSKAISASGKDLVSSVVYDAYGREQYKYLPYVDTSKDGSFKTDPFNSQKNFYQNAILNPGVAGESIYYNQTVYEASPLNRVLKSYNAGNSWASEGGNHPIESRYLINTVADSVRVWRMDTTLPATSNIYAVGTLYKNVMIDEAGNQVIEYKDMDGRVVLKKVQLSDSPGTGHIGWLSTYYVYDDAGNLRFVIPPLATEISMQLSWNVTTVADELCFQYQYDSRKRLILKKMPGGGAASAVYDIRDRLVFTQDAVQKLKSPQEWFATLYDNQNRPVMTAIYKATITPAVLQTNLNAATGTSSYSFTIGGKTITVTVTNPLPGMTAAALTPLSFSFYDKYTYAGVFSYETADILKPQSNSNLYAEKLPAAASNLTNGLVTGKIVRVLDTDQWLATTNYYNDKGRPIQVIADNIAGGKEISNILYDFNGKVLSTYARHTNPRSVLTPQTTVLTMMSYDAAGRLAEVRKRLNDDSLREKILLADTYDELGQLKMKRLGVVNASSQLDTISYAYNVRGWTRSINKTNIDNWFAEELSYDNGFTTSQYNGNIAGVQWKTKSDGIARAYGYSYDKASRLTLAYFSQQNTAGAAWLKDKVDFTVSNLSYDANGNIKSMNQQGVLANTPGLVDQLTYSYSPTGGNKLKAVADGTNTASAKLGDFINGTNLGDDYAYDANGSLTADANKGISAITYNALNLPASVIVAGKGSISYLYDATGIKLRKTVVDNTVTTPRTTVTDYIGGFVYRQDTLQFISHEEGRIRPLYKSGQPVTFAYDYFEKDHLGNVRVVLGTQSDSSKYVATMETAATAIENALFSNIDNTRTAIQGIAGYPTDNTTNPNEQVARLNAVNGQKIGPSLVLRVMAGDTIQLGVKAFYKSTGTSTSSTTTDNMLAALIQAFSGGNLSDGAHNATGVGSPVTTSFSSANYDALKQKDPTQNDPAKPKAYLNYVLFDDRFSMVNENSGVKQVQGSPDALQTLGTDRMVVKRTGFLYIYTSNESGEDVYFDNLVVAHNSGPLLEETHYYPFGLAMAGISSKALKGAVYIENRYKFNGGSELQSGEFSDGAGLELYSTTYRNLDPQLGRFWQIDPLAVLSHEVSPYAFALNNPILRNDPTGLKDSVPTPTLKEVVITAPAPLKGGAYNGQSFQSITERLESGIGSSYSLSKKAYTVDNTVNVLRAYQKNAEDYGSRLTNLATLGGGGYLVSELKSLTEYKEILAGVVRLIRTGTIGGAEFNPATFLWGMTMTAILMDGAKASADAEQLGTIITAYIELHSTATTPNATPAKGIYAITTAIVTGTTGGTGYYLSTSYYDITTKIFLGEAHF